MVGPKERKHDVVLARNVTETSKAPTDLKLVTVGETLEGGILTVILE